MLDKLGEGKNRITYTHENPNWVIKIPKANNGHNQREYKIWKKRKDLRKWLVPVVECTDEYLIQVRGKPTSKPDNYPRRFVDVKRSNWVEIDGEKKLCDYGSKAMYRSLM